MFGNLGGKRVVCARGRFHYYEGYSPAKVSGACGSDVWRRHALTRADAHMCSCLDGVDVLRAALRVRLAP